MRKITSNKRGFTLTEIILVIAIIVILSAAVATGIAIDINRYNDYLENLKATGGTKWEADAREKTDDMFPKYVTPKDTGETTLDTEETEGSEDTEETEDTEDTEETKDTEGTTESSKETNVPPPTETSNVVPETSQQQQQGGGIQSGVLSGSTNTGSQTINAKNGAAVNLGFDNSVKKANKVTVVYSYSGDAITSVDNWGHLGSGAPAVSINNGKITLEFDVKNMQQWQKDNLMNNSPHFHSNGSNSIIQIESVTMS